MPAAKADKVPEFIFYVDNGFKAAAYFGESTLKSALKNSPTWSDWIHNDERWYHRVPRPGVRILFTRIGSSEGWQDVSAHYIRDGEWAW